MVRQIQDKHCMEFSLKCNCKGVGAVTEAVLILFDSFQLLSAGLVAFTVHQEPCDKQRYARKCLCKFKSFNNKRKENTAPYTLTTLKKNINR